jgi:predicted dehydrogenase
VESNPEFDAGVIVTPADTHFKIASSLINKKKPVYVEKPFMLNSSDASEIVRMAKGLDIPVMIGANRCVFAAYRTGVNLFKNGDIGELEGLSIYYKHTWDKNTRQCSWRQDPMHPASGIVMDHFAHYGHYLVDLGFQPKEVRHLGTRFNENGVDVDTAFYIKDKKNKMALIVMDGSPSEIDREEKIIIYGTSGKITTRFEKTGGSGVYLEKDGQQEVKIDNGLAISQIQKLGISDYKSHPALIHNYLSIVNGCDVQNASPGYNGIIVASMTEAILKSRNETRTDTMSKAQLAYFVELIGNKEWLGKSVEPGHSMEGIKIYLSDK